MPVVKKLTLQEQAGSGFTHSIKITSDDLTETTANTAQTFEVLNVAEGDVVVIGGYSLVTPFSDASDAAFNDTTVSVGDGSDVDRLLAASQINENGSEVATLVTPNSNDAAPYAYNAADTLDVVVNSMAAKSLSDLDAGEIVILAKVYNLKDLTVQ